MNLIYHPIASQTAMYILLLIFLVKIDQIYKKKIENIAKKYLHLNGDKHFSTLLKFFSKNSFNYAVLTVSMALKKVHFYSNPICNPTYEQINLKWLIMTILYPMHYICLQSEHEMIIPTQNSTFNISKSDSCSAVLWVSLQAIQLL